MFRYYAQTQHLSTGKSLILKFFFSNDNHPLTWWFIPIVCNMRLCYSVRAGQSTPIGTSAAITLVYNSSRRLPTGIQSQRFAIKFDCLASSFAYFTMAKTHRSKPHQLKLSETGKPHELSAQDWFAITEQGIAKIEADTKAARVAVLRLPFIGWVQNGQLCIARIGASVKSTWLAFERRWLETVKTRDLYVRADGHLYPRAELGSQHPQAETFEQREARVFRERDAELFIESLDWQTNRQKKNKNLIRWVSEDQLLQVLSAFHRLPATD